MEKKICVACQKEDKKSTIMAPMYGTTTLIAHSPGYHDEEGIYHSNINPNTTTYEYTCSNGHSWSESN